VHIRPPIWDDLETATQLLAAQSRAATGVGAVRPELVRAERQSPGFEVGRDNWIAEAGDAAVSPSGGLVLAASDPRLARIAVRTFAQRDAAAVHNLLGEAYLGWDSRYVPIPHEDWVQLMTSDVEFDATVWWLAERESDLASCALHEFARRGVARVGLKVDASNPTGAVGLYERLGFSTERRETTWCINL
jgi:hypothetical protein